MGNSGYLALLRNLLFCIRTDQSLTPPPPAPLTSEAHRLKPKTSSTTQSNSSLKVTRTSEPGGTGSSPDWQRGKESRLTPSLKALEVAGPVAGRLTSAGSHGSAQMFGCTQGWRSTPWHRGPFLRP